MLVCDTLFSVCCVVSTVNCLLWIARCRSFASCCTVLSLCGLRVGRRRVLFVERLGVVRCLSLVDGHLSCVVYCVLLVGCCLRVRLCIIC